MKKHLLLLTSFAFLFSAKINSQVTITATAINPVVGEGFNISKGNYVNPGSAGANQTWTLTGLSAGPSLTNVIAPGSTLIGASFPNSNVCLSNATSNSSYFYKTSSTSQEFHGKYENSLTYIYSNVEEILRFPFTHLDSFADTWNNQYQNGAYTFYQRGTTTVKADGYGTLIIGSGTYNNVMRVRVYESWVDSTYQIGTPMITTNTRDEYKWYMNGIHVPLATSYSQTNNLSGQTFGSTFLVNTVGLNEYANNSSNYFLFPNPAKTNLNIAFHAVQGNELEIKIINALGAVVKEETVQAGMYKTTINIEELTNGVYFAEIKNGNTIETKRFVVAK